MANIPAGVPEATDHAVIAQTQADNTSSEFSGSLHIQIPRSLHRQLSESAEREGVSLNQYILYKLAR